MAKLKLFANGSRVMFHCPGCKSGHQVIVKPGKREDGSDLPVWKWNGSLDRPTFEPSLHVHGSENGVVPTCHSFIRDGFIQFLSDCTHEFAGQTVEIPDWEG